MCILDIDDVIIYITTFLDIPNRLKFLSLSKNLHILKDKINYDDKINFDLINKLWYYDRFTNVVTNYAISVFPKFINHLTFGWSFNQDIKDCIPNSVTHLTFDDDFNQDIKDCIPNSVTHLTFGNYFNQNIKDCIPNSVTHLTFGYNFNQDIKDCIPQFSYSFNFWL